MFSSMVIACRRKSWPSACGEWSKNPLESTGTGSSPSSGIFLNRKNSISGWV